MDSTETVITEIRIGITGRVCDFVLPAHVAVSKLVTDLVALTEQAFPEVQVDRQAPMLLDVERQRPLPGELTLAQSGVRDGSRLMLV